MTLDTDSGKLVSVTPTRDWIRTQAKLKLRARTRIWTRSLTNEFSEIGFAMRYNSLRVEQGVEHLVSPIEGFPKNLKEMNLKDLEALTSILTDLTKVLLLKTD